MMKRISIIVATILMMFGPMFCSSALAQVKEITIWSWGAKLADVVGLKENTWPLIEQEFGIKVNHEFFPGVSETEFVIKVITATRFGKGPDVIDANAITQSNIAWQGILEPIPSWLNKSLQEKLLPGYKEAPYLWDKDGYKKPFMGAIVGDSGALSVWWNKEMYREAGLDRSPRTWKEVFEFGKKLTRYGSDGSIERSGFFLRTSGHGGGIGDKWTPYLLSAGAAGLLKMENGKIKANLNTEVAHKVVQFYLDGLYKHKIDAIGIPGDIAGWERGETATISSRRFMVVMGVKKDTPNMYPKLGVGPIPTPLGGMESRTTSHIYGLTVNSDISSEKKELIWKIFDRINQFDMLKPRTIKIENWLPYKELVGKSPFTGELWQNILKYTKGTRLRLEAPRFSSVHGIWGEQLHLMFTKEKSIEAGLSAAAEKIGKIYEDMVLKEF